MNKDDKKRTHIIVTGKGGGGGSDAGAVRFDEAQTLTSAEQLQARENIGVPTEWFGTQAEYDLIDPKDPNTTYHIEGTDNVQADWNQSDNTQPDYIKNKPELATVATTGNYSDLNGTPSLATVATSGSYNDLQNKPTIPAAPVQSDWNEADSSSLAYIANKPTIPAAQVNSDWNEVNSSSKAYIQNKPSTETLTFTLQGGTTVTLDVYVAPQLP